MILKQIEIRGEMEKVCLLFILMAMLSPASCYCPREKIHSIGQCAYRIECIGNIRGVRLQQECLESANYPVTVDLKLTEAIERFDNHVDQDFLGLVTSLTVSANWTVTNLSLLHYTARLEQLTLSGNNIEKISGTPFYYLNNMHNLDLSHNQLSDIGELFQFELHPNKLTKLSLAYNDIDDIPADAFEELTSLIELDLSYNKISNLNEEPFSNLTSLEILRLNNNSIKNLNGAVNNLHNLRHLYLRNNQIQNIDVQSLKIITHLETFDVSRNQLDKINSVVFLRHWKHLGSHATFKIILADNHIYSLPNTSKEISARYTRNARPYSVDVLTELDLSNNEITNIEYNAFQSLLKMISLDLSKNKIIDFVVNADDLKYVKYLNLSGNSISRLYFESFRAMTNLQNLDLSHNNLDYIPDQTFTNNYNLKNVNMTFNDIEKIDNLHIIMFHPEGGILDLSNNGLTQLKIALGEGLRLTFLKLHSNNISDPSLIELIYQNDLKYLDLSRNNIRELNDRSLRLPVNLISLDFSCNMIRRIGPSTFHRVGHLKTLRLSHNQLSTIEFGAFQGLTALINLDLSFNSITSLDSKLLTDLKSLTILSLRSNGMQYLNDKSWYSHKWDLKVFVDGNNLTCEWLGSALSNFNNGFSRMRPVALMAPASRHSVEGIPCVPEGKEIGRLMDLSSPSIDERLLVTNQKILEAVREQTYYLRRYSYVWRSIVEGAVKEKPVKELSVEV